jgi:outer membrane lipoprotein-sorting protein
MVVGGLAALGQDEPAEEAKPSAADPAAQETFQKALAALAERQSISATLVEFINITEQPLKLTGRYLEAKGKSRLELQVKLTGGAEGSILEVVDGEMLWSQTTIGEARHVTLRNLKQISAALAELPPQTKTSGIDLGLGGLSGLMTSVERTMEFQQRREEGELIVLEARWKPEFLTTLEDKESKELPAYVPDVLRISLDAKTLFPKRFQYLKRNSGKESLRPYVRLDFQSVQLDGEIDQAEFQFTPPEDLVPDDVTTLYIDQLKQGAAVSEDATETDAASKE